jgi:hypothetical protein
MARRTLATIERPEPHIFSEDPDVPPGLEGPALLSLRSKGRRLGACDLRGAGS